MTAGASGSRPAPGRHLQEEEILAALRAGVQPPDAAAHLDLCARCAGQAATTTRLIRAARESDRQRTGKIEVPAFDTLLAQRLPGAGAKQAPGPRDTSVPVDRGVRGGRVGGRERGSPAPSLRRSARLAAAIVLSQARVIPTSLAAFTIGGLLLAVLAALAVPDPIWGDAVFASAVALAVSVSVMCTCVWVRDPRRELLYALPVSPAGVLAARLTFVLTVDMAAASGATVALALTGRPAGIADVVGGWLGPSLLAAAISVVLAVWQSARLGSAVGIAAWFVGSITTLPRPPAMASGLQDLGRQVWATSPFTVGVAVVLLALAVRLATDPERHLE